MARGLGPKSAPCLFTLLTAALLFPARWCGAADGAPPSVTDARKLWVYRESISLGVAEEDLSRLVSDCQERGFATAEIQRILGLVARVKMAGLPHWDLLSKLREGLVKRATPEVIDTALANKAVSLGMAKNIVDRLQAEGISAPNREMAIQVVSDALDAGMSSEAVTAIVRERGRVPEGFPDPAPMFEHKK